MLVSRDWYPVKRNGIANLSFLHYKILKSLGLEIHLVGPYNSFDVPYYIDANIHEVNIRGTGSLYSPIIYNSKHINNILCEVNPDIILVESLQNGISEIMIKIAYELNCKVILISHGISLQPYSLSFRHYIRSFLWLPYWLKLKSLINKTSAITTQSLISKSKRFLDRDIAKKLNIPIYKLSNVPFNYNNVYVPLENRKKLILVVGYFSEIKNQLLAIKILEKLDDNIKIRFIGKKSGNYYMKCRRIVNDLNLNHRVDFYDDSEVNLASEISNSYLVLVTSITEIQPLILLEAMSSGTPFISSNVGCIDEFSGGLIAFTFDDFIAKIKLLFKSSNLWMHLSSKGQHEVKEKHSYFVISTQIKYLLQKFNIL